MADVIWFSGLKAGLSDRRLKGAAMNEMMNESELRGSSLQAQKLVRQLEGILNKVYADMDVNRQQVKELVTQGKQIAATNDGWSGGPEEQGDFLSVLDKLEEKINQAIDLKKLKEAGLVKAVKL